MYLLSNNAMYSSLVLEKFQWDTICFEFSEEIIIRQVERFKYESSSVLANLCSILWSLSDVLGLGIEVADT